MITKIKFLKTKRKKKTETFVEKRLKTMKMYSTIEESVIYYEKDAFIYQLVKCQQDDGGEFYVVRDKEDNPMLASIEKEPAMTFFFHKCRIAEETEPKEDIE